MNNAPCSNCGSTEWCITDCLSCDKCNQDLDLNRLAKMSECKHERREESRIVGCTNCLDCGMCGIELIEALSD